MRLFIAINFNNEIKNKIYEQELLLKEHMVNGHITSLSNIHLTLIFIGETLKPKEISGCIEKINLKNFDIFIKGFKYFNRDGKRLYYLDIKKNNNLNLIYNLLFEELTKKGFDIEDREYKPHITLAREVILDNDVYLDDLNLNVNVNKVSLMESKRINGKLEYVELYYKKLGE
ncbi:MAG: RNA 2',3'-cyclic phosphodiesterase [Bacilli bacterium]|nr:RNA 2',3'-cyclic phosphodiesterase [Bacilli bacterium]